MAEDDVGVGPVGAGEVEAEPHAEHVAQEHPGARQLRGDPYARRRGEDDAGVVLRGGAEVIGGGDEREGPGGGHPPSLGTTPSFRRVTAPGEAGLDESAGVGEPGGWSGG
ncbi:MAG: hypothetical protein BGO96_10345 [Micrococcales bacterium 73-15]|nr:MAG: hypothetical protein BGO96_10345 [Micrococcales bacterium 73-15]